MKINKTEYSYFPCKTCGVEGLRYKDNPCNKCKRQSPQQYVPTNVEAKREKEQSRCFDESKTVDTNRIKEEGANPSLPNPIEEQTSDQEAKPDNVGYIVGGVSHSGVPQQTKEEKAT